jgi:hypothetical protein
MPGAENPKTRSPAESNGIRRRVLKHYLMLAAYDVDALKRVVNRK